MCAKRPFPNLAPPTLEWSIIRLTRLFGHHFFRKPVVFHSPTSEVLPGNAEDPEPSTRTRRCCGGRVPGCLVCCTRSSPAGSQRSRPCAASYSMVYAHSLPCSSIWGLPCRILNIYDKKGTTMEPVGILYIAGFLA